MNAPNTQDREERRQPKLLLLARSFPPVRAASCQRTWNIAKYLSRAGWEVTVVTPHPRLFRYVDDASGVEANLRRENINRILTEHRWRCLAPNVLHSWNSGPGWVFGGALRALARRLGIDPGAGWIRAAERECSYLSSDVDLVIASGPPFASFKLAKLLANRFGCPYVLDYRDPWTGRARRRFRLPVHVRKLEDKLLKEAAAVIAVSPSRAKALQDRFNLGPKIHVITNGYDPDEAAETSPHDFGHFAIVYAGIFSPPRRVVTPLTAALKQLKDRQSGKWYFHYYGRDEAHVREQAVAFGIAEHVVLHGYVPRKECLAAIRGASVAITMTSNDPAQTTHDRGNIPGKLFELIGLGPPILLIGRPDGDAAAIVRQVGRSGAFAAEDIDGIAAFLSNLKGSPPFAAINREAYGWHRIASRLDILLRTAAGMRPLIEPGRLTI